jgi:copper chaperone CopZ
MKQFIKIIVAALLLLPSFTFSQIKKAEIVATGLTCSMCSNAINKQLKKNKEVEKVTTDLNSNTFTVFFKESATTTPQSLKESIQKAGFFVGDMKVTYQVKSQKAILNKVTNIENIHIIAINEKPSTINGLVVFKIFNQGYLVQKEFKKFASKNPNFDVSNLKKDDNLYVEIL